MASGRTLLPCPLISLSLHGNSVTYVSLVNGTWSPNPPKTPAVPAESQGPSSSYHPIAQRNGAASRPYASFDHKIDYTSQNPLQGGHTTRIKARKKWWQQSRCCQLPLSPSAGQLQRPWNDKSPPRFCPSGNTWQYLEITIVMTCGSATGIWWADIRDLAKYVTMLGRTPPQIIIYPMPLVMSPGLSSRVPLMCKQKSLCS